MNKTKFLGILILLVSIPLFANGEGDVHFNPWELIIYRPENSELMNDERCWLKFENEEGEDVTYTAINTAWYEFPERNNYKKGYAPGDKYGVTKDNIPREGFSYKKTYYLSGGMAMHLNIKPGKYKISFYTPIEKQNFIKCQTDHQWESNIFEYNTENPLKVIFVSPTANDNGFYNGGWIVDYKAPKYYKFTIPQMQSE